jgi:serine/threonine protein kinase
MHPDDQHSSSVAAASQDGEPPWDLIAERVDALAAAWDRALERQGPPPALGELTADMNASTARHVLLELVKLDLERRWQHQVEPREIERYLEELPQLGPLNKLPVDVIYEELQARMMVGQQLYQEDICSRFPAQAEALLRLLGGMAVEGSPTATYYADTVVENKEPRPAPKKVAPFKDLKPGDKLDDFQLLTPLGSGAFASVFLARQISMERLVALKISQHVGSEPQTLAQLDHPHIVRVYDQRHSAEPPARLLYMEVVSGGTLQDVITRVRNVYDGRPTGTHLLAAIDERLSAVGTPIPESSSSRDWIEESAWHEVVCRLGAELAEGLEYAHKRGVMHRDIKPANVLLSAEARPKLADFNVSYNGGRADENPEDTFGGSLAYMSPEQLEACHPLLGGSPRSVREGSDVYALGVVLWELLTGRRPFRDEKMPKDGGSLVRLQRMIETRRQTDLNALAAELPADCPTSLRSVLVKCLRSDKSQRYQSAADLSRALRLCLNPRCWRLLEEPRTWLGRFVVKRPVAAVVIAGLLPNIATAAFNFLYNLRRIEGLGVQALVDRFWDVQGWLNFLAFASGIVVGAWIAVRALRLLKQNATPATAETSGEVLLFGRFVSMLVLALWTVSGIAFPILVGPAAVEGRSMSFVMHFFASLAVCGCAAMAYPYFLITAMSTHYFLPAMVRRGALSGPTPADLERVAWYNRLHLALAALVPLLGVMLATAFTEQISVPWAMPVASGGGLLMLLVVGYLWRVIDLDTEALGHLSLEQARSGGSVRKSRGSHRRSRR